MRNGLAIGAIERAVVRRRLVARGTAAVDFDDGRAVKTNRNTVYVGLRQKRLQCEGKRDQQRDKIARELGASPDLH